MDKEQIKIYNDANMWSLLTSVRFIEFVEEVNNYCFVRSQELRVAKFIDFFPFEHCMICERIFSRKD